MPSTKGKKERGGQREAAACPSCGRQFADAFCAHCGEKRIEQADYSLWRFLGDTVQAIVNVEAPFLRTLGALIGSPGQLTADYLSGRRRGYIRPLQLFLLCNLVYFLVQPAIGRNTFATPLAVHLYQQPYSAAVRDIVVREVARQEVTLKYQARFDRMAGDLAKSLVIAMAPLWALLVYALYWRTRRYYVEHLIFSLHIYAAYLLILPVVLGLLRLIHVAAQRQGRDLPLLQNDNALSVLVMLAVAVYVLPALRRVYAQDWAATVAKAAVLLVLGLPFTLQTYRLFLFFVTFLTVR